jgi:NADH:ubiquinone oxidoreductase subunit 3 (subunit A)
VGAVTPSFAALLFAILCFVAAAIQVLGFIGVAKVCFFMLLPLDDVVYAFKRKRQYYTEDMSPYTV